MKRNWGLPPKDGAFVNARTAKPLATLGVTAVFGVIGAAIAAISFNEARSLLLGIFPRRIACRRRCGRRFWLLGLSLVRVAALCRAFYRR